MVIKLVREFKQNQQLSITPQLKKSIDLLQLSRLEIINKINNEIEENPFLKKDFDNESTSRFDDMNLLENLPCLLYTSPSPRDRQKSRMPSSA